ncbi:hypothetical protein HFC70_08160 [Agrobacterium sp. a22-2]|uniref:hypothetical protein n=1 Tax=Agrobacterium sp. a22-2 TaxID=2283840 RepID=UPI001444F7E9|nr:hypothetical protein [Agrobacterium sp. a22-2]NKN36331.1 hypothetical protein [Agrobacterium sp. a22-2]
MGHSIVGRWSKGWDRKHDGTSFIPSNAEDAVVWLNAKLKEVPPQHRKNVQIEFKGSIDAIGIDDVSITMFYDPDLAPEKRRFSPLASLIALFRR